MDYKALLGFAPFLAFALVEKLVGIVPGLLAGFVLSAALILIEWIGRRRITNILEIGSALIFGALAILALCKPRPWSIWEVRFYVDAGLALLVLLGMLLRRPFTLASGRTRVKTEAARSPAFLRHNIILSSAWGVAFAALAATDLAMTTHLVKTDRYGIILTLVILAAAIKFTIYCVARIRRAG